jgi:hypothetical protein
MATLMSLKTGNPLITGVGLFGGCQCNAEGDEHSQTGQGLSIERISRQHCRSGNEYQRGCKYDISPIALNPTVKNIIASMKIMLTPGPPSKNPSGDALDANRAMGAIPSAPSPAA